MQYAAFFRISKNASMLLFGTMLRMVFAFGFVVYAARYLGVEGYGKYALTQQLFDLFVSLTATGFAILVTREVAKDRCWLGINLVPLIAIVVLLGVSGAGLLMGIAQLAGYAVDTQWAIRIACVALIPAALAAVAEAIFIAFEKAEVIAFGVAIEGVLRTTLCAAALFTGHGLLTLFMILIATRSLQLLIYSMFLVPRLPAIEVRGSLKRAWSLLLEWRVFAAETWLATISTNLDLIFLSFFYGEVAVGLYDAGWKLIRFGPVIASSFTTAVFPYMSRLFVNARDTFQVVSEQSVKYILACIFPAVLVISFFADRIVLFLFAREYVESIPILRILAWLLIPQFLNPFLSRVLYARGHQRRCLAVAAIGLTTFLTLATFLIPRFGPIGTAWTVVISSYTALLCYVTFATSGTDRRPVFMILMRQLAAAGGLLLALMMMRDTQLVSMVMACPLLYAGLLFGLRIVSFNDVKLLQELH